MNSSPEINKIAIALCKAQTAMGPALKDTANPFFKSTYADLRSCWEAVTDHLAANELALTQLCKIAEPYFYESKGENNLVLGVIVETILMHSSGQWISGETYYPLAKRDPQGVGSAITYGRRYGMMAILGLTTDDDDGNAASNNRSNNDYDQRSYSERNPPRQNTTSAPPPPPPEPPAVDWLGTGEAKKKEAKLKDLCSHLNKAGDRFEDANKQLVMWNSEILNTYCQSEFDKPLKEIDKTEIAVLLNDLQERLDERLAMQGDTQPAPGAKTAERSHTGPAMATPDQIKGINTMCDIKHIDVEKIVAEFTENSQTDPAQMTEEQAAAALKALPKR